MRTPVAQRPRPVMAVTLIGVATVILGLMFAVVGGFFVFAGTRDIGQMPPDEQQSNWAPVLRAVSEFVLTLGVVLSVQGVAQLVAGAGVVGSRRWARVLTLVLAVPTALWGVALLATADPNFSTAALGTALLVYGVLAWSALLTCRREFSLGRV